jgi:hypothetical protein
MKLYNRRYVLSWAVNNNLFSEDWGFHYLLSTSLSSCLGTLAEEPEQILRVCLRTFPACVIKHTHKRLKEFWCPNTTVEVVTRLVARLLGNFAVCRKQISVSDSVYNQWNRDYIYIYIYIYEWINGWVICGRCSHRWELFTSKFVPVLLDLRKFRMMCGCAVRVWRFIARWQWIAEDKFPFILAWIFQWNRDEIYKVSRTMEGLSEETVTRDRMNMQNICTLLENEGQYNVLERICKMRRKNRKDLLHLT